MLIQFGGRPLTREAMLLFAAGLTHRDVYACIDEAEAIGVSSLEQAIATGRVAEI